MTTEKFLAPDISCGHCVMAIKRELGALEGVQSVDADETSKEVVVTFEPPADMEKISRLMEEIGYPIAAG